MSGGWAAKELTEQGLKTLVLDRGKPLEHGTDYITEGKAPWEMELRGKFDREEALEEQRKQMTCYAYSGYTKHHFINDKENPYEAVDGTTFDWFRTAKVGGKSLLWARFSYRFGPVDFESNKLDGHGIDWPIRYSDLEKWYDYVELFAGVSGNRDNIESLPDGIYQPPQVMNIVERHIKEKVESNYPDRHMIIGRCANLTEPTEEQIELGRSKCQARRQCERGCSFGANFSSLSATLPAAERTGNLTLQADSIVHSVLYDEESGKASGVRYINTKTGEATEVTARVVFMCASAISTLQVLLNSRSETYPDGIGNSSGVLGHYVMDHPKGVGARGIMPGFEEHYYQGRRPTATYIPRFRNLKGQETDYYRGFGLQGGASREGWGRGSSASGIGADFKNANRKPGRWTVRYGAYGEALPYFDNHVRLSETKTDQWGLPILQASVTWRENEYKQLADASATAAEILRVAGLTDVEEYSDIPAPGNANHEMGGACMGRDPKTSYLNKWNQSHDVPNLFVTDGSSLPSGAVQNPSLTYMAISARAANHAARLVKDGVL